MGKIERIKAWLKVDSGLSRGGMIVIQVGTATGVAIGVIIGRWLS